MGISISFRVFNANSISYNEPYEKYYRKIGMPIESVDKRNYYDIEGTYDNAYYISVNQYDSLHPILFAFRTHEEMDKKYKVSKKNKKNNDNKLVVLHSGWITIKDYYSLLSKDISSFADPVNRSYDWSFWNADSNRLPNALPNKSQEIISVSNKMEDEKENLTSEKKDFDAKKEDEPKYGIAFLKGIGIGAAGWFSGTFLLASWGIVFSNVTCLCWLGVHMLLWGCFNMYIASLEFKESVSQSTVCYGGSSYGGSSYGSSSGGSSSSSTSSGGDKKSGYNGPSTAPSGCYEPWFDFDNDGKMSDLEKVYQDENWRHMWDDTPNDFWG